MRKHAVLFGSVILVITLMFAACSSDDDSMDSNGSGAYTTVSIDHWGFDFSAAKNDTTNWGENNDGWTAGWSPTGAGNDTGIWYSTPMYPNRTQNLGKIDITSVTAIDTTAAAWDIAPPPLAKDDVMVAQCLDGFVKLKVVAEVDTSQVTNPFWSVRVMYLYSTTPSFDE